MLTAHLPCSLQAKADLEAGKEPGKKAEEAPAKAAAAEAAAPPAKMTMAERMAALQVLEIAT